MSGATSETSVPLAARIYCRQLLRKGCVSHRLKVSGFESCVGTLNLMGQIIDFNFFLKTQPVKKYHLYIF